MCESSGKLKVYIPEPVSSSVQNLDTPIPCLTFTTLTERLYSLGLSFGSARSFFHCSHGGEAEGVRTLNMYDYSGVVAFRYKNLSHILAGQTVITVP